MVSPEKDHKTNEKVSYLSFFSGTFSGFVIRGPTFSFCKRP